MFDQHASERYQSYLIGRILHILEGNIADKLKYFEEEKNKHNYWPKEKELFEKVLKMINDFQDKRRDLAQDFSLMDQCYTDIMSLYRAIQ